MNFFLNFILQILIFHKYKNANIILFSHVLRISNTFGKIFKLNNHHQNNSYLCNKLGKVIFFLTRCGIFNRDEVEIKNASSTEKTLFLRIAHMIFSTGVWKIHKIWIFLIYY
jgi:hypothetical protein